MSVSGRMQSSGANKLANTCLVQEKLYTSLLMSLSVNTLDQVGVCAGVEPARDGAPGGEGVRPARDLGHRGQAR